ncbi:MAG: AmpG family muropeptide MFS transporter [Thermodesulfovibrionales bacterium]|nr:AmpG family muropeptide MFS transporter [Thermodesulfovibrionales bacterium]
MKRQPVTSRNPWTFVPSLYFAEGLPYIIINTVSVILYKKMGIDNASIAFWTSWLYLPWVIKMFWSPLVDIYSTKRRWIISTQFAMAVCLFLAAYALNTEGYFFLSLSAFIASAFVSATHDIATDGFYMLALNKEEQALFVGIRATFYRLAMIFGSGLLIYAAGRIEAVTGSIPLSWTVVISTAGIVFVLAPLYHTFVLPFPATDSKRSPRDAASDVSFLEIFSSYFRQEKIWAIIAFILLYRFAEAMLLKLAPPFLLDSKGAGGLGLSTSQVGLAYGTVGMICLVLGGILGGWLISKFGLRKCIWPMAITLHFPDIFYVYMAYTQPEIVLTYVLVALEQFGYGLGFTAFMVYLMYAARGRHKTSHFAISTGIMALGMMLPGFISGYLQQAVGYRMFFVIVCVLAIPGILTILFIPKDEKPDYE